MEVPLYNYYDTATLKCLSIGTPKAINFPFVSNEKLMFFRCPSIQAHCRSGGGVVDNTLDYQSRGRKIDPPLLRSFG